MRLTNHWPLLTTKKNSAYIWQHNFNYKIIICFFNKTQQPVKVKTPNTKRLYNDGYHQHATNIHIVRATI